MVEKKKQEELILEAKGFFEAYKKEIGESVRTKENVVHFSFSHLAEFSPILSERLIDAPQETLALLEDSLKETGLVKDPRIRFLELPKTSFLKIRDLRARHLDKLLWVEGIIRQASDVRPQVVNAKFECPTCGAILSVLQIDKAFREPPRCSCGRKGGFTLVAREWVDVQRIVIEESPDSLSGGEQPRRIHVFLQR